MCLDVWIYNNNNNLFESRLYSIENKVFYDNILSVHYLRLLRDSGKPKVVFDYVTDSHQVSTRNVYDIWSRQLMSSLWVNENVF